MRTKFGAWKPLTALASAILLAASVAGCGSSSKSDDREPPPAPRMGNYQGTDEGSMLAFRGIRYAKPPVGELRFAPPQPVEKPTGIVVADKFGSACPQYQSAFGPESLEEDCLFLNVYVPKAGEGPFPVMVWIHGGAFVAGSGGPEYDPSRLVAQGVVVVTINYRLGPLGFLAHRDLTDEQDGGSGNYGLMDQQLALRWVQDNISTFGGDPNNVTIFGESAGGLSVLSHVVSPKAQGLFQRAIVQSGSYDAISRTLDEAEQAGQDFVAAVGCDSAGDIPQCLRELDVKTILDNGDAIVAGLSLTPHLHPDLLPKSINQALQEGEVNVDSILLGSNRDEFTLFIALEELNGTPPMEEDDVEDQWFEFFGPLLTSIVSTYYPATDFENPSRRFAAPLGDSVFSCTALRQAEQLGSTIPVYVYEFADRDAPSILPKVSFDLGAAHAFEIQYVLGSEQALRARGANDSQIALSNAMVQYWTAFARTGDPNQGEAEAIWPEFGSTNGKIRWLNPAEPEKTVITSADFEKDHRCKIWDEIWNNIPSS